MPVNCLTTIVYAEYGRDWRFEKTLEPTRDHIIASIDRSHEVQLWTRDQGFADQEKYVTYDRELVLRIARHFGETGEPLPDAPWEYL